MTEITEELRERIRGYLAHNATKPREAIKDLIAGQHRQLLAALDGLTDERASIRPPGDEWCVKDVLHHATQAQRWVATIVEKIARGESYDGKGLRSGPAVPSATSPLAELSASLDAAHAELLQVIDGLPAEVNGDLLFEHPFFGPINALQWAVFQRVHDADHTQQIQAMLQQV